MKKETYILRHVWEWTTQDGDQDCDDKDYILIQIHDDNSAIAFAEALVAKIKKQNKSAKMKHFYTLFAVVLPVGTENTYREIKTDF